MTSPRLRRVPAMREGSASWRSSRWLWRLWVFTIAVACAGMTAPASPAKSTVDATAGLLPWKVEAPPALALTSLDERAYDLTGFSDHVVLVHFFATWCEPCRAELATLDQLSARFSGRALTILAVDVGEPEDRVRKFFQTLPVRFPILLDTNRAALKAWNVDVLPSTFVLGPGLCPLWSVAGDADWNRPDIAQRIEAAMPNIQPPKPDEAAKPCANERPWP